MRRWTLRRLRAGVTRTRSAGLGPWLVLPALALLVVFVARPVVRTVQLSGYASDLIGNPTRFVGLGNYRELLGDPTFARTVFVSLAIALLGMALATSVALLAALLLRSRLPGGGLFAVVLSLPFAYSAASASAVFAGLFAPTVGVLNLLLGRVGVNGPAWLANPVAAVWAIAVSTAWYEFGFAFLVLTAAVGGVAPDIVEAARLDGAGGIRLATTVIVPIIRPSILFLTVTQTISGLQTFAQIQVLTRGGPAGATRTAPPAQPGHDHRRAPSTTGHPNQASPTAAPASHPPSPCWTTADNRIQHADSGTFSPCRARHGRRLGDLR